MKKEALIVCAGNEIMGDDGIGIKIGEILKQKGYSVINIGTDIFKLASYYRGEDKIIIIDAVVSKNLPPGSVIHLKGENIFENLDGSFRSAHYMGIIDGIKLLRFLYDDLKNTEVHFIGVTVREVSLGENLSEDVKKCIPGVIEIVHKVVENTA